MVEYACIHYARPKIERTIARRGISRLDIYRVPQITRRQRSTLRFTDLLVITIESPASSARYNYSRFIIVRALIYRKIRRIFPRTHLCLTNKYIYTLITRDRFNFPKTYRPRT